MSKKLQRLLAGCVCVLMLLSLSACGERATNESSANTGAEAHAGRKGNTEAQTEAAADAQSEAANAQNNDAKPFDAQGSAATDASSVYNGLFSTDRVHMIDVTISADDWADLLANPLNKTKYKTNVTIDGETLEEVSFSTKGNTSLSSVASDPNSNRYSFKLNFGKYNKEQTYHGLNKLSLNNLYADASYLKDYISYELSRQAGVDAPLVSFVWLRINGEDHGLYLAIEDVSEAWLERTQDGEGVLYKPETEELDQMNDNKGNAQGDFPFGNGQGGFPGNLPDGQGFPGGNSDGQGQGGFPGNPPDGQGFPGGNGDGQGQGGFPGNPPDGQGFPGGNGDGQGFPGGPGQMGFGNNAKGADLRYTDDNPESYSDIFDNDETDMDEGAQERVIAALKALSEGDPADALDTDEVIRYFAAHNFVLNYDSYTGNMLHNYYLYENDGKLSMLPWDYNLSFGGFMGGLGEQKTGNAGGNDATSLLNTGIDTPLSGSTEESRPMWAWIVADESYLEQYHEVFDELLRNYFENGSFEAELDHLTEMLRPYVEKDPSAFYSVDEFDTAVATLKQVCLLRAESIRKQLNGELSTCTDQQDAAAKVDASGVNIQSMGSMGGGRR